MLTSCCGPVGGCAEARWGLKPEVVHWLYVAIVRPTISFAYLVWWRGCQTASAKKRLSKVQTGMFRDNGSDSYDSYRCYGGTDWPPSARSSGTGEGEVGGTSPLDLGCWSYLHPNRGHGSILMRLRKSDPILNLGGRCYEASLQPGTQI